MIVFAAGCANSQPYMKLGVADHHGGDWENGGQMSNSIGAGVWVNLGEHYRLDIGGEHHSQLGLGFPFNDDSETSLDRVFADFYYFF